VVVTGTWVVFVLDGQWILGQVNAVSSDGSSVSLSEVGFTPGTKYAPGDVVVLSGVSANGIVGDGGCVVLPELPPVTTTTTTTDGTSTTTTTQAGFNPCSGQGYAAVVDCIINSNVGISPTFQLTKNAAGTVYTGATVLSSGGTYDDLEISVTLTNVAVDNWKMTIVVTGNIPLVPPATFPGIPCAGMIGYGPLSAECPFIGDDYSGGEGDCGSYSATFPL